MKKFKIVQIGKETYIIFKRGFFFDYKPFGDEDFYNNINECKTHIHKDYYPDECEIEIKTYKVWD